jgi:hypothetical protein
MEYATVPTVTLAYADGEWTVAAAQGPDVRDLDGR